MKTPNNNRNNSRNKKYLIKENGDIFLVKDDFFNNIKSRTEALNIAVQIYMEIQRTLKEEALSEDELFVGKTKVTAALERSLIELENRFPSLLKEVHSVDRMDGQRVFKS